MTTAINTLSHKMQRAAAGTLIDMALGYAAKDRQKAYLQMVDWARQFWGDGLPEESYDKARAALSDPDNKWVRYIDRVLDETDPHVARVTALNLGFEAFLRGTRSIRKNRELYQCNIPWLILFDPTSACNMHCEGCWAGTYGGRSNLSFEDMDKILTQGKELGVYLYMLTGGEPLVRKADIIRLAEKHSDAEFAIYTNSTLIDEAFCNQLTRLGNIIPMLSIEGTPETNDARRGGGHYAAVMRAMDLLKQHGIPFGTSICYTRANVEAVTSDSFLEMIAAKGGQVRLLFPLYAGGQRCCARPAAHGGAAGIHDPPHPLPALKGQPHRVFPHGLPERRPVCGRMHRRRQELLPHQLGGGRGALRLYPLFQRQHPRQLPPGDPAQPPVHGLPGGPAFQPKPPAPLPHAGESPAAGGDGPQDRRP